MVDIVTFLLWDGHSKRKGKIGGTAWIQAVLARSNHDIVDSAFTLLSQIRLDAQIWGRRTKSTAFLKRGLVIATPNWSELSGVLDNGRLRVGRLVLHEGSSSIY